MLHSAGLSLPFVLEIDMSDRGLWAILSREVEGEESPESSSAPLNTGVLHVLCDYFFFKLINEITNYFKKCSPLERRNEAKKAGKGLRVY